MSQEEIVEIGKREEIYLKGTTKSREANKDSTVLDNSLPDFMLEETIVALATPVGSAGVAIIRLSGERENILNILEKISHQKASTIRPRFAYYTKFYSENNNVLDKGVLLYFKGPHSYTGEDVLEIHCHGGPVVVDCIIEELLKNNIRLAEPGEFTKRAWLNGKMDLTQVEAVSDLINASSKQAVTSAVNTLNGEFSKQINKFLEELISLRVFIEASIDFSDQEIDFIKDGQVSKRVNDLKLRIVEILNETKQGVILREGVKIVIAGEPNAGKSSLLNALSRKEEAIVTSIPGTTRDVIKTSLSIKGVPVHIYDTAGLRETNDIIEKYGIDKAYQNFNDSDFIFLVVDLELYNTKTKEEMLGVFENKTHLELLEKYKDKLCLVFNKIDKISNLKKESLKKELLEKKEINSLFISAKHSIGIVELEDFILNQIGYKQTSEGRFIARRRHVESLCKVQKVLDTAEQLLKNTISQDLIAEELRCAQVYLGEITGEFTPDELLGNIFSSFCIGK